MEGTGREKGKGYREESKGGRGKGRDGEGLQEGGIWSMTPLPLFAY